MLRRRKPTTVDVLITFDENNRPTVLTGNDPVAEWEKALADLNEAVRAFSEAP